MFQGCNGGAKSALGSFRFQIQKLKIKVNDQCFKRSAHNCLSAYLVLEGLEQPICNSGSFCVWCKKSGHMAIHCRAKWRSIQHLGLSNGASSSKAPLSPILTDCLPNSPHTRVSSTSLLDTNLSLSYNLQISSTLLVQQTEGDSLKQPEDFQATQNSFSLEKGHVVPHLHPSHSHSPQASTSMAYQRADRMPFAPRGFQPLEVHHRELMARAVINPTPASHEDFAIVSITPLPAHAM
jgi:hypothetical protein